MYRARAAPPGGAGATTFTVRVAVLVIPFAALPSEMVPSPQSTTAVKSEAVSKGLGSLKLAKIPPAEMIPPAADAGAQSEAYAAAQRARATPPPSSK